MGKNTEIEISKEEFQSFFENIDKIAEMSIYGLLAIEGFRKGYGPVMGPVALKLALAPAGTIPVSQTAGLAMLALLGLTERGEFEKLEKTISQKIEGAGIIKPPFEDPTARTKEGAEALQEWFKVGTTWVSRVTGRQWPYGSEWAKKEGITGEFYYES